MKKILRLTAASALSALCFSVQSAPVSFIAADNGVSSLAQMLNSLAARNAFLAVTGPLNVVDFESALPANLSIAGGSTVNGSSCGALCGFNTSTGGSFHREVFGGSVTFSFTNPVDAFGFFVNGLQTDAVPQQTIQYVDGSLATQVLNMPPATNGGGAFVGFVDYGQLIASVTFNATNDILGFDDLLFGRSATDPGNPVSEPGSLALLGLGATAWCLARRRRSGR